MLTVIAACLLGLTLGSYLLMVRAESVSVARSQAWNAALVMAGAGVEEALAALNQNATGRQPDRPPPDLSTNGWPRSSNGFGPLSRDLVVGALTNGSYNVFVTTGAPPVIYSTGYVRVPSLAATISRVIRVTTTNAPLFTTALAAKTGIALAYSGISSDSFDSSAGQFQDAKSNTNGSLACVLGSLDIAYRQIHGDILLGPNAILGGSTSLISGRIRTDLNVDFPETALPAPAMFNMPSSGVVNGVRYDRVFINSGDYNAPSLNDSVYVSQGTAVNIQITGIANLKGVYIAGTGNKVGRLQIYMAGPNFTFGGTNVVESQNATNLNYLGLAGNTNINVNFSLNGTTNFFGTIYAPAADLTLTDDYNTNYPYALLGSVTAKSITQVGSLRFHFDENLLRAGPRRGYLVTSWQEL